MRLVVVAALAGCGRIGFDPVGGDSSVPAVPITSLPALTSGPDPDWVRDLAATGDGYLVALDAGSAFAIDGGSPSFRGGTQDAYVISLAPDGAVRWTASCGSSGQDLAVAVAADPDGNVYFGGGMVTDDANVPGTGNLDCGGGPMPSSGFMAFVASFTPAGALRWAHTYPSADPTPGMQIDAVRGLAWAGDRLVATGFVHGNVDFGAGNSPPLGTGDDGFVLDLDANGGFLQLHRFGTNVLVHALAIGADGTRYITGEYSGTVDFGAGTLVTGGTAAMIVAYDASGAPTWARSVGDAGTTVGRGIAIGANGDTYTVGSFDTSLTSPNQLVALGANDGFIAEFTPAGQAVQAIQVGSPGCEYMKAIAAAGPEIAVVGSYSSPFAFGGNPPPAPTGQDGFVATYGLDGTPHGIATITGAQDDSIEAIAVAPNGVLVGGWLDRPAGTCGQGLIYDAHDATLELLQPQ